MDMLSRSPTQKSRMKFTYLCILHLQDRVSSIPKRDKGNVEEESDARVSQKDSANPGYEKKIIAENTS